MGKIPLVASDNPKWDPGHTLLVFLGIVLLVACPFLLFTSWMEGENQAVWRLVIWIGTLVIALLFCVVLGHGIRGGVLGALVNPENRMSLTKLQLVLWSVIGISTLLVAAVNNINVRAPSDNASESIDAALEFSIPAELWLLLGINITSVLGTSIIANVKAKNNNKPAVSALRRAGFVGEETVAGQTRTITVLEQTDSGATRQGVLLLNTKPSEASVADLFSGIEVGNTHDVDVGKVQMFFFTVIVILSYGALVGAMFAERSVTKITALPEFSESLVTLIAISHAGYLANLAAPHTETVNE